MSYRSFYITNGKSVTKQLAQESSKIFLHNPAGLGFSSELDVTQYQNVLVSDPSLKFPTINGEIIFFDDSISSKYDKYNSFVSFLTELPLTLYYVIPTSPAQTYSIDIDVISFEKTEVKENGLLTCSFDFQGLSRWKGASVTLTGASSTYSLVNNGHMPVGFEITLVGTSMVNPYFTLEQNSEVYGEAKFLDSTGFSKVIVNSQDGEQNVELEQGGSVLADPLSYQDLSISNGAIYVTFVKVARGTSTLTIGMDSGSLTSATITFTPIYRSV